MNEITDLEWELMKAVVREQNTTDYNALPKIYEGTWEETTGQAIIITENESMLFIDSDGPTRYL